MSSRRLPLEQALLGFLMEGPVHGYDLHQQVQEGLGEIWTIGISNVYGVLRNLEQAGHVESSLIPQENRPPRKVFSITPRGAESFLAWLREPVPSIRNLRVEFPAKLFFFRKLDLEGADDLIVAQETLCRTRMEELARQRDRLFPHDINRLVFDFRWRQIAAIVEWLQVCREEWV